MKFFLPRCSSIAPVVIDRFNRNLVLNDYRIVKLEYHTSIQGEYIEMTCAGEGEATIGEHKGLPTMWRLVPSPDPNSSQLYDHNGVSVVAALRVAAIGLASTPSGRIAYTLTIPLRPDDAVNFIAHPKPADANP